MKKFIRQLPIVGGTLSRVRSYLQQPVRSSAAYWDERYRQARTSGDGSYGESATFKAAELRKLVTQYDARSLIELGCGDGNQLMACQYPPHVSYLGYDVSPQAVRLCRERFAGDPGKRFEVLPSEIPERADVALSLDVVYHLVEDDVFEHHMHQLFGCSRNLVVLFSTDRDDPDFPRLAPHVRHRPVRSWVQAHFPNWRLVEHIVNPIKRHDGRAPADFFVYKTSEARA